MKRPLCVGLVLAWIFAAGVRAADTPVAPPPTAGPVPAPATSGVVAEVKSASLEGKLDGDTARLVIQANLGGWTGRPEESLYAVEIRQAIRLTRDRAAHRIAVQIDALRGGLREIALPLHGDGEVREVTGDGLDDWSVRRQAGTGEVRVLVLRLKPAEKPVTKLAAVITAETRLGDLPTQLTLLSLAAEPATLGGGYVRFDVASGLDLQLTPATGLIRVDPAQLPEALRTATSSAGATTSTNVADFTVSAYRFHGEAIRLPVRVAFTDPAARQVVLGGFQLDGEVRSDRAAFLLTARAQVGNPQGGEIELVSGDVALEETTGGDGWNVRFERGRFVARFERAGEFPVRVRFYARVKSTNGWNDVRFRVSPGALSPVTLRGLGGDKQVKLADAARPERDGDVYRSFLPGSGQLALSWREAQTAAEGKLFYSAELVSQIAVSAGLYRLTSLVDLKVMQGELGRVAFRLPGEGEVTRVTGAPVLSWSVEPVAGSSDRLLTVQFNQPQRDLASLQVQLQQSLGTFPVTFTVPRLVPEGATRTAGFVRIVNDGAVRLEMVEATGVSQISPEQFVSVDHPAFRLVGDKVQVFAYRHAGPVHQLQVRADNILPELSVSEVLAYRLGENELLIDAEFEVDVREAPLRELLVRLPKGYSLAQLSAAGLSDHFVSEPADAPDAQLRLVYGAPVIGRQVVQLRLERNAGLAETRWVLPRLEVLKSKATRGHVGVSADAGFRLASTPTTGLTELAPAFFPKKIPGLQAAFRLNDPAWQAAFTVERLAQSIQADVLHLFSVGEGIAYGSSLINYGVSGAPVSTLQVELSPEYFNVEFTGKNIRNWQKTERGFQVQLHTPVAGAYTLLATYERPFKAQGETLAFTGARPADAQTEQGHTLVVSTYQFQVQPVNVSPSLTPLETAEVPAEYRLFFDAPILAAYRYTARPFNLQLELRPLAQAPVVGQVIDRAALTTRISEEGQVVTEARYFVKNKGTPHLRLRLPAGAELWSVTVDGATVVPVKDDQGNLIPLPNRPDPNVVTEVAVKMAARSANARSLEVTAPVLSTPILLGEWQIEPAASRRLIYQGGTLTPADGLVDVSGFGGLAGLLGPTTRREFLFSLSVAGLALLVGSVVWARGAACRRWGFLHLATGAVGAGAILVAGVALGNLYTLAVEHQPWSRATGLHFLAPVQQGDVAWRVQLGNVDVQAPLLPSWFTWVLFLAAGVLGLWSLITQRGWLRRLGAAMVWTLVFWAMLRRPYGAPAFFLAAMAFVLLQILLPMVRHWWTAPPAPTSGTGAAPAASGVAALVLGVGLLGGLEPPRATAAEDVAPKVKSAPTANASLPVGPMAESVTHQIRVENDFVFGRATVRWNARRGQELVLFQEPGVLTESQHPTNLVRWIPAVRDGRRVYLLVAETNALVEFSFEYQTPVVTRDLERGFPIPVRAGLVHEVRLTVVGQDVEVFSPQAVLVERLPGEAGGATNTTVARVLLAPAETSWLGWKPRSRDTSRERAVFYAEATQMFVPGPGVLEGFQEVVLRPAQGEVRDLVCEIPPDATVTDVLAAELASWRFDPDTRRLRVEFSRPQAKPFRFLVRSQIVTRPLPFARESGLLRVLGAAGQVGTVGVATSSEVQLDDVEVAGLAVMNLEDFPGLTDAAGKDLTPGVALRRAFRYATPEGRLTVKASAVEPDVRVESQQTLSLGEDRTVLAATLDVEVLRAGIFKWSFALPTGLEVETVSGAALSHWTESKSGEARIVTLNLKGKTEGRQGFVLTLVGPGVKSTKGWEVPRLVVREAAKQRGQLIVVPEQGLRLQVAAREGATQLDPVQVGARQKGVLAFRLLQEPWRLTLDLEQVDAWVQVTSLQHFTVAEGSLKAAANLQYEIENTGVRALVVRLPVAAENVHFRGTAIADFLARTNVAGATNREWEVKLERRWLGKYLLRVEYTLPVPRDATEVTVDGLVPQDVNLHRGFVTVQAGGRLQVRVETPPSLQATEWQVIPRALQQDLALPNANYAFRLVESAFRLPLRFERRDAARLLPARVNEVALSSVVSDDGTMLTQVRMVLIAGDKRLLHVALPAAVKFWFAFVNQNSVWPWQSTNEVLLPLDKPSRAGEPTVVEFFYSGSAGAAGSRSLNLDFAAPRFDLPLENIRWTVFLNDKWKLKDWKGSLQLQEDLLLAPQPMLDLNSYLQNEQQLRQAKTKEAEQFLNLANNLLEQGDPQQARRAFQAAYGNSLHDQAFNEDARVQLNNLKMQQTLVGLNVRQARVAGEGGAPGATPRGLRENQPANYTQAEAKQWIERNPAEENAVQLRLAERLVQQQDAAVANPTAIRATLPESGKKLTFTRPLEIDPRSELRMSLRVTSSGAVSALWKFGVLALIFVASGVLAFVARGRTTDPV